MDRIQIQRLVTEFASQLEAEIRRQVEAEIRSRLDRAFGRNGQRASVGKGRGQRLARRSTAEIERMTKRLLTYIKANPGQRSEEIAAGLGVETAEMVIPIKRLLAAKAIRSAGFARGTTYTTVA